MWRDSFLLFGVGGVPELPVGAITHEEIRQTLAEHGASAVILSGGVDSAGILALGPQPAYTLVGETDDDDGELARAQLMARHVGVPHTIIEVDSATFPDHFADAVRAAGELLYNGRAVGSFLFLDKLRALGVESVASGLGADEIFGDPPGGWQAEWALARTLCAIEAPFAAVTGPAIVRHSLLPMTNERVRLPYLRFTRTPPERAGKRWLREAFAGLVPDEIRLRPKVPRYVAAGGPRWQALYDGWLTPPHLARFEGLDVAKIDALRAELARGTPRQAIVDRVLLKLTSMVIS